MKISNNLGGKVGERVRLRIEFPLDGFLEARGEIYQEFDVQREIIKATMLVVVFDGCYKVWDWLGRITD